MPLMLPPAPRKRAAEARATKAMSRVYSIRSCPCSSCQKLRKNVMCSLLSLGFMFCDRLITCLSFRDLAITAFSVTETGGGNCFPSSLLCRPEYQRYVVVVDHAPMRRFLQGAGQRRARGQED